MISHPYIGKNLPEDARAVPEGFTLPWNTTRTMAGVWRDDVRRERYRILMLVHRAVVNAPQVSITRDGKVAFAGYDKTEVQFKGKRR